MCFPLLFTFLTILMYFLQLSYLLEGQQEYSDDDDGIRETMAGPGAPGKRFPLLFTFLTILMCFFQLIYLLER
jgi:hypothetical protein